MTKEEMLEKLLEAEAFIDDLTAELESARSTSQWRQNRIDRFLREMRYRDRMEMRHGISTYSIPNHRL